MTQWTFGCTRGLLCNRHDKLNVFYVPLSQVSLNWIAETSQIMEMSFLVVCLSLWESMICQQCVSAFVLVCVRMERWAATIHMLVRVIKFAFERFWLNIPRVWNWFISRWNSPVAHLELQNHVLLPYLPITSSCYICHRCLLRALSEWCQSPHVLAILWSKSIGRRRHSTHTAHTISALITHWLIWASRWEKCIYVKHFPYPAVTKVPMTGSKLDEPNIPATTHFRELTIRSLHSIQFDILQLSKDQGV